MVATVSPHEAHRWFGHMLSTQQSHSADANVHLHAACEAFYTNIRLVACNVLMHGDPCCLLRSGPSQSLKGRPPQKSNLPSAVCSDQLSVHLVMWIGQDCGMGRCTFAIGEFMALICGDEMLESTLGFGFLPCRTFRCCVHCAEPPMSPLDGKNDPRLKGFVVSGLGLLACCCERCPPLDHACGYFRRFYNATLSHRQLLVQTCLSPKRTAFGLSGLTD